MRLELIISKIAFLLLAFMFTFNTHAADCSYEICWDTRDMPKFWHGEPQDINVAKYLNRERIFSKYSWKYALSSAVVYELAKNEEPFIIDPKFGWKSIGAVPERDSKLGFHAQAWFVKNQSGNELVITFRGTDCFWKDFFKGNFVFAPFIFGRTQFDAALDFSNTVIAEASKRELAYARLVFSGHSLGGGLAQYVQRLVPCGEQRLVPCGEAIVFDPSPNKGRVYSLFKSKQPTRSTRVYEKGEILEYPRKIADGDIKWDWEPGKAGKSTIWMDFYDDGPGAGHSIRDLAMSLLKVAMIDGDAEAKIVFESIISQRSK